ncbi:uncharacterized protein N0V89_005799 [Didymosphaeria variabile]|uniref:Uncharacterized protein n=1 Tax=Didymosphaeria variabile TaxID=1932322 RepID=A0A9W9CAU0_9PLEO|nr:uncharacterized protein N0V89_005799 [Didymosphaeria variabile]KAJ4354066.1 hypothetical protein N0V89_005799 [Didymosphaeria variabile]
MGQHHPKPADCPDIFNCHNPKSKREALQDTLNNAYVEHPCVIHIFLALCLGLSVVNAIMLWRLAQKARTLHCEPKVIKNFVREGRLSRPLPSYADVVKDDHAIHDIDLEMGDFVNGVDVTNGHPRVHFEKGCDHKSIATGQGQQDDCRKDHI